MSESLLDLEMLDSYRELASPEDPDFFRRYLKTFLEGIPVQIENIEASIRSADAAQMARAAHAIKSSCMNVGASVLVERCAKLEAIGKSGSISGAESLYPEIAELFRRLVEEVHALPEFRDRG